MLYEFGTNLWDETSGHCTRFIREEGANCAVYDEEVDAILVRATAALFTDEAWEKHCNNHMNKWAAVSNAIDDRVAAAIGDDVRKVVVYSAYQLDDDGLPIDNLDDIAAHGEFIVTYDGGWGDGEYASYEVVTDPTYLELTVHANSAIIASGDNHHIFFEGFDIVEDVDGVPHLCLYFGS